MTSKLNKVIVIMSTFNGEKYIQIQLDSIFRQKGVDLYCLIRDDGSTDTTVSILEAYKIKYGKQMDFIAGNNLGVVKSFGKLISMAVDSGYPWIALCDQDDVWKEDKLDRAIKELKREENQEIPLVYCSNLELVNAQLESVGIMRKKTPEFNRYTALVQNCATGCTQVFNREAALIYCQDQTARMEMHDYWMFLIGVYLGKLIYDDWISMYYRQHSNNVVGAHKKTVTLFWEHLKQGKCGKREKMMKDFVKIYSSLLSKKDIKIINRLINSQKDILSRMVLFFDLRYRGYTFKNTIGFKCRVLLEKIY